MSHVDDEWIHYVACHPCGYANQETSWNYYFAGRGAYQWGGTEATDFALNYEVPLRKVSLFAQGEVTNFSKKQSVVRGSTTIRTLAPFDPFTETPVEGVHCEKRWNFGRPTGPNSSQQPRTLRFSLGVRF